MDYAERTNYSDGSDHQPNDFFDGEDEPDSNDDLSKIFTLLFESTKTNSIENVKEILSQYETAYEFRDEVHF